MFLEIFILMNLTTATSWEIKESQKQIVNSGINLNNKKDLLKLGANLLVGLLTIKQIGVVSAAGETGGFCCEKTLDGAYCQDVPNQLQCDNGFRKAPTTCDSPTSFCQRGVCYSPTDGFCYEGSPKQQCLDSGGSWTATKEEEPRCMKGCCNLGRNTQFTTRSHCVQISELQGSEVNFDQTIPEEQCVYLSPEEGACLSADGSCRRTNEGDCKTYPDAEFHKGFLCSYYNEPGQKWAGTGCKRLDHISCSDKENQYDIYWFDSCGNRENPYNGEGYKLTSWNGGKIREENLACSGEDCGICDYENGVSKCAPFKGTDNKVTAGDFYCKPLTCKSIDKFGDGSADDTASNGESWCVYDGPSQIENINPKGGGATSFPNAGTEGWIGSEWKTGNENFISPGGFFGRDAVGAGHFMRYCDEGDVVTVPCGTGDRGEICSEIQYEDGTMRAQCRANLWFTCFNFQTPEECTASPNVDCRWQGVNVDKYFQFGACVPKYPKGFDLNPTDNENGNPYEGTQTQETTTESGQTKEEELCNLGSQECKYIEEKQCQLKLDGWSCDWRCVANCDCKGAKFTEHMQDFCVSLGDCGAFYNVEGEFTTNGYGTSAENIHEDTQKARYETLTPEENQEAWKNGNDETAYTQQNTPFFIPLEGSEGTYGELGIFGAEIDASWRNTMEHVKQSWEIGFALPGGIIAVGGALIAAQGATILAGGLGSMALQSTGAACTGGPVPCIVVGAIAVLVVSSFYLYLELTGLGDTREKSVRFECKPWRPPLTATADQCSVCNNNVLGVPCTKYKCESLGSGCRLLNGFGEAPTGETDGVNNPVAEVSNPICVDLGKCGVTGGKPVERELKWVSSGFEPTSVDGRGGIILTDELKKIPENSIINFTIETNDYSVCKYTYLHKEPGTFESEGEFFNEGNYPTMNHTLAVTIPWLEDERIQNDEFKLYVRCIEKCNKFINVDEYVITFPIDQTPDRTAPLIFRTEPSDPGYLAYGVNSSVVRVVTNEPAKCNYDFNQGILFGMMVGGNGTLGTSENGEEFYSSVSVTNMKEPENQIYIKCSDNYGNNNTEDFPLKFIKSPAPLNISTYLPEKNTLRKTEINAENPFTLSLTTIGGAFDGSSNCSWTMKRGIVAMGGDNFVDQNQNSHSYIFNQQLIAGDYNVEYTCKDNANNVATAKTNFTIEKDEKAPLITRVYLESSQLKFITNENAQCFFNTTSNSNCDFDSGTEMESGFNTLHAISYKTDETYYVRCKDEFNNKNPKCAIIVKPGIF